MLQLDLQPVVPLLLPEPASAAVGRGLADLGVTFHFGPLAQAVNHGDNNQLVTELSDGTRIESDVVLSAIGLRPRIALAKEAGLAINRGIITDKTLKTSAEDIYALGDCAEVQGHVLPYVLPLMASARALAKTLAGEPTPVSYGVMPVTVKPLRIMAPAPMKPMPVTTWAATLDGSFWGPTTA